MIRYRRFTLKLYSLAIFLVFGFLFAGHLYTHDKLKRADILSSIFQNIATGFYFITRLPRGEIYLYSAVANPDERWGNFTSITINLWDGSQNKKFDCCIFNKKTMDNFVTKEAYIKNNFGYSPFIARQYQCHVPKCIMNATHVGMVERGTPCSIFMTTIPVFYPSREKGKLALCAKIAYGTLSPQRLIEWFEYHRLMGVDKVLTMVQYLNEDAYKVLLYYQKLQFGEIDDFPLPLPGKLIGFQDRGFEEYRFSLPQCSHDKQVGVYSCQEKLQGYDYVGVVDFDEYIVHDQLWSYKDILNKELMPKYSNAAGFTFNVSFFILDWGDTGSGDLYLTKYVQRTEPRVECFKNIYIPNRVSEVTTHTFTPKTRYKRYLLSEHNTVMHHYRECPNVPQWKNCMTDPRTTDLKMEKIRTEMTKRVKAVQKYLGIYN